MHTECVMIRDTTLSAYIQIQPELSERQKQVYDMLKVMGVANNLMLSRNLGLPVNCVTGRCKELRDLNIVTECVKKPCPFTGKTTWWWQIK